MTEAQQIAQNLGLIVAAASCCEQFTEERVNAVSLRLLELVTVAANDGTDADLASEQFLPRSKWVRLRSRTGGSMQNRQRSP
jgi:hypothetical protein